MLHLRRWVDNLSLPKMLVAIFVLATFIRLFYLAAKPLAWSHELRFGDEPLYHGLALSLLEGKGYTFEGEPRFYPPPLYPAFIALVYWVFGISPPAVRVVQAILGGLLCVLVSLWATYLWGKKAGLLVGLFSAFNYTFVRMAFFLRSENLYLPIFVVATMVTWYWVANHCHWSKGILSGTLWTLSILVREAAKPIVFLIAIWVALRNNWQRAALLLMVLLVTMLPWSVRNRLVAKYVTRATVVEGKSRLQLPLFLRLLPGGLMYISFGPPGLGPRVLGDWNIGPDILPPKFPPDLPPSEREKWLVSETISYIRSNPVKATIGRIPRKFVNILMPFQSTASLKVKILLTLWYLALLILSIPSWWQAWRSSETLERYFAELVLIIASFTIAFHTLFFGVVRYRYPVDVLLLVAIGRWALKWYREEKVQNCNG